MSIQFNEITRRGFIGASASIVASAALMPKTSFATGTTLEELNGPDYLKDPAEGGNWVTAACWHNCGGRCMNKVMVKDGAVIRQKTDDTHPDSAEYPQQRGCIRGKVQQQQCFGADRILHPLKRKNWQPGGGEKSQGQLRGRDEWEVISWDEAIEFISEEISRIKEGYGGEGFYMSEDFGENNDLARAIGAGVSSWQTSSMGTYQFDVTMYGMPGMKNATGNDRFDMKNADTVFMWSSNPAWSAPGTPVNTWLDARDAGVSFVSIDPMYNASAHTLDAEWVPVINGTDMALMLGIAYEMLRLDEEQGGVVDWEFLHKYCVGFDDESMPADAKSTENLKGYLLGSYDDTPKTADWASERCGVPAAQIEHLAKLMSKKNNVMILHNFAFARNNGAEQVPQMLLALACMGGHIGRSGNCYGSAYHAGAGNAGDPLVSAGKATSGSIEDSVTKRSRATDILSAIADGGGTVRYTGTPSFGNFDTPEEQAVSPVKCIIHGHEAHMQTSLDQKANIAAHRAVDFVLTPATFMTSNARYSDIILPLATKWEVPGGVMNSNREFIIAYSKVTDPLGESKTDQEMNTLILEALGMDASALYPVSEEQAYFEQIANSAVVGSDGEMVPLVTITKKDISEWGVKGKPQAGVVSLSEFVENGGYQFRRTADDGLGFIGYKDFIDDPKGNPLPSKSGKFELYCQKFADTMAQCAFPNSEAYKPYPTYIEAPFHAGYASTFKDNDIASGEPGEYPYLMFNPHYLRRSHAVFDNCPWLREAWANPAFMSRSDAEAEGIEEGDTVLVSTYAGQTLRKAAILDTLRPGVIALPHGAWVDVDEETGVDRAGSDNYLTGGEYSGFGVSGYNNLTCRIERYSGKPLEDDCDLPSRWSGDVA